MLKKKRFWIGIIATIVFLYFVFRGIDFNKLWEIVKGINIWLLIITITIYIGGYYIRAIRWHHLLKHIQEFKARELFPYLVMGFMFNNILPARAGEFIRAYLTGARKNLSKSSTFATIIIERVFDGLVMIFYFIIGYFAFYFITNAGNDNVFFREFHMSIHTFNNWLAAFAVGGSFVFAGIFVVSFFLIHKKEATVKFLYKIASIFPKKVSDMFGKLIDTFIEGFGVLRNKKDLFTVSFYSFLAWTVEAGTYYMMAVAMGIKINFLLVALIMAVANFAIMAPSTSGGVGPFEFFGVGVMLLFAFPKEEATAYIILIHSMILLPIIVLGFIFLFKEGLDFGKLMKTKEGEENG